MADSSSFFFVLHDDFSRAATLASREAMVSTSVAIMCGLVDLIVGSR